MLLAWLLLSLLPAGPSLFIVVRATMRTKTTGRAKIASGFERRPRCTRHAQSVGT